MFIHRVWYLQSQKSLWYIIAKILVVFFFSNIKLGSVFLGSIWSVFSKLHA